MDGCTNRKKLGDAVYLGMVYERDLPAATLWRVYRVQMFELGHPFAEIDSMSLEDIGDVLGYWSEKSRAEAKLKSENDGLNASD